MYVVLWWGSHRYHLFSAGTPSPVGEPLTFNDELAARVFLSRFRLDAQMWQLRRTYAHETARLTCNVRDEQVLATFARELARDRLRLVWERPIPMGASRAVVAEPEEPDVPPEPTERQDWIEVELKKKDGSPAVGEAYEIHLTDGTTRRGQFDASGKIRFDGIPAGTCLVGFPELAQRRASGAGGSSTGAS